MESMSDALSEIALQPPTDPDAQATVTDFLDYTEYLPSDLIRSLTLIRKLDDSYLSSTAAVHSLTKVYGSLPSITGASRPDPQTLRTSISQNLNHAINARESAYAESSRLYDVVDRHYNRLTSIIAKLHSLPKPPSRDPTPAVPQPVSPRTQRFRTGRKADGEATPPPRITLRLDGSRVTGSSRPPGSAGKLRHKQRKVTVPGEVLPPRNPNSPPSSTDSEWESEPPSPIPVATSRVGGTPIRNSNNKPGKTPVRVKISKPQKLPKIKPPKSPRPPRPPGVMGTNVHSSVAGISSSNALALLKPPPDNAVPGSKDAPWMRLTPWEMAKLRKRMKKNAIWSPSETMIRRELAERGRGPENKRLAQERAAATGEPFIDEVMDEEITGEDGHRILAPGEISAGAGAADLQLSNRGMKLNEAKKLKKENLAREQAALAAAEAELAAQRLAEAGSAFKDLFKHPTDKASVRIGAGAGGAVAGGKGKAKDKGDGGNGKSTNNAVELAQAQLTMSEDVDMADAGKGGEGEEDVALATTAADEVSDETFKVLRKRKRPGSPEIILERTSPSVIVAAAGGTAATAPISANPVSSSTGTEPAISPKRLRGNAPAPISTTITVPLAAPGARAGSSSRASTSALSSPTEIKKISTTAASSKPRRSSVAPRAGSAEAAGTSSSQRGARSSLGTSTRANTSVEPPSNRERLRRGSNASVPPSADITPTGSTRPATRRSKRPAPGPVTSSAEGGTAVSVGKRKAAPKKKAAAAAEARKKGGAAGGPEEKFGDAADFAEEIDPDEPRYCLCGDVSFGTMICCENNDCEREWFHLECVGLNEPPGRTTKWYCPDCRKKLGIGEKGQAAAGRKKK